jgi:hypothetical protein
MNLSDSIMLTQLITLRHGAFPEKVVKRSGDFTQLSVQQLGSTKIIKKTNYHLGKLCKALDVNHLKVIR